MFIRRVVGSSMTPTLRPGQLVVGWGRSEIRPDDIVIVHHQELEKIKRVQELQNEHVFVVGDNTSHSTDSRSFGWLPLAAIRAKILWPRKL